MSGKRFLSIALAGLMVVSSLGVGNIKAYASDVDTQDVFVTESTDEAAVFESEDAFDFAVEDEVVGEDQEEVFVEEAPVEDFAEDAESAEDAEPAEDELIVEEAGFEEVEGMTLNANGGKFSNGLETYDLSWATRYLSSDEYKPTREGKIFIGWYAEPECKTLLSQSSNPYYLVDEPEAGTVIYAGWGDYYTVTFVLGTDSGTDPIKNTGYFWDTSDYYNKKRVKQLQYKVQQGKALGSNNYPSNSYCRNTDAHYTFDSWYTDEARTQKVSGGMYNFTPTADTTLYAGFKDDKYVVTLHSSDEDGYFKRENYNWEELEGEYKTCIIRVSKTYKESISPDNYWVCNKNPRMALSGLFYDAACTNEVEKEYSYYYTKFEGDTDLYIKWEPTNKVVTFKLNSDTGYFRESSGKTYVKSTADKAFGTDGSEQYYYPGTVRNEDLHYKFLGWSTNKSATAADEGLACDDDDGSASFNATFTEDTTLYGVWDKTAYKVATFDAGNGTFKAYDHLTGESVEVSKFSYRTNDDGTADMYPSNPTPKDEKQVFEGWYVGNKKIDSFYSYVLTADTTFTAKYAKAYLVTLDANGGYFYNYSTKQNEPTKVVKMPEGTSEYLDTPKNDGDVVFGGWYLEKECKTAVGSNYLATKDITLYARWLSKFTVTFDCRDGKSEGSATLKYTVVEDQTFGEDNSMPTAPVPNDSSKVFQAWYSDENCTEGNRLTTNDILNYVVSGNTTFYANYVNSYTVTFKADGGFVSKSGTEYSVKVAQGEAVRNLVPSVKSTETKVFRGWFTESTGGEEIKNIYSYKIEGNTTLYAQYTECYVLTFHANQEGATLDGGKSEVKVLVTKGTAYRYGDSKAEKDVLFQGPSLNTSNVKTGNIPFISINYEGVCWTTSADGTGDNYIFGKHGHSCYRADGTSYSFNMYGFVPTGDMDFYAKWGAPVKVIWDPNGGEFRKNTDDDQRYGTLNSNGQRVLTVPKGVMLSQLDRPYTTQISKMPEGMGGCSFAYSDKDGKDYLNGNYVINSNTTIYAHYYKSSGSGGGGGTTESYKVTLHANEGHFYSSVSNKTTTENYTLNSSRYTPIPNIDDPNLAFAGWYSDEACTKYYPEDQYMQYSEWYIILKKETTDLYAKYAPVYNVKLDANGGYFDESIDRTKDPSENMRDITVLSVKPKVSGQGIVISDYTKRIRRDGDKIFAGWYLDKELTKKATITSKGSSTEYFTPTAETTLYAKWVDYELPVSIKVAKTEYKLAVGDTVTLSATVTPESAAGTQDIHWFSNGSSNRSKEQSAANPYGFFPIELTSDGKVTAQAAGDTSVYAEVNGVRSEVIKISVSAGEVKTSISVSPETLELAAGDTAAVTASVTPQSKAGSVKWKSANTKIATVDGSGSSATITAVAKGTTKITATVDGKSASVSVTVSEKAQPIKLSATSLDLIAREGEKAELTATLGSEFSSKTVIWESSDPATVAITVDPADSKKATVDPVDEIENTTQVTITATIEGTENKAECTVIVRPVGQLPAPYADVPTGTVVKKGTLLTLATKAPGATIYYTVDGTDPVIGAENTKVYGDGIQITYDLLKEGKAVIKAMAALEGMKNSAVSTFEYTIREEWGDIEEDIATQVFGGDFSKIPTDVWYLFDSDTADVKGNETGIIEDYTGESIIFNAKVMVFHNTRRLIENRDYKVSYANNVNAGKAGDAKEPTVTVTGMGSYNSSKAFTFTINKADIKYAALTSESAVAYVEGKTKLSAVKPVLVYNGKKLKAGTDYEVKYYEGEKEVAATTVLNDAEKLYSILIVGKGNFEGTYSDMITVRTIKNDKSYVPVSKLKIDSKALNKTYDGKTVDVEAAFDNSEGKTAVATVKNGKETLVYGKDFLVKTEEDNTSAGKHSFMIIGLDKGEPKDGEVRFVGQKIGSYEIKGTELKKTKVVMKTTLEYTGKPFSLEDLGGDQLLYDKKAGKNLVNNTDFEVDFVNTGCTGKFTVTFTGKGGYTGTLKKDVTVKPVKLAADKLTITVNGGEAVTYEKSGAKPSVEVAVGDTVLEEGIDFTVTYKNNTKVAEATGKKAPTAIVKGIGNYKGTTGSKTFAITKASASQLSLFAKDVVYNAKGKAGYFLVTPKVMDGDKAVKAGKGKDVEAIAKTDYRYFNLSGQPITKDSQITAGMTIVVSTLVKCGDKSPYVADANGTEVMGYYRVVAKDLSKSKIEVVNKSRLYVNNGEEIKLTKADLKVTVGSGKSAAVLTADDFDIVSITNNRFIGKATLTIRGKGNYGGTKSTTVNITPRSLK